MGLTPNPYGFNPTQVGFREFCSRCCNLRAIGNLVRRITPWKWAQDRGFSRSDCKNSELKSSGSFQSRLFTECHLQMLVTLGFIRCRAIPGEFVNSITERATGGRACFARLYLPQPAAAVVESSTTTSAPNLTYSLLPRELV